MKHIYLTLALLLGTGLLVAQTITNGDFENWEIAAQFEAPTEWNSTDLEAGFLTSAISQSNDAVEGVSSIRLETIDDDPEDGIFGFALAGVFGDDDPEGGFPYVGFVEGLRGQYKWDVQVGDSANIILVGFNSGVIVGMAVEKLAESATSWTEIQIEFEGGAVAVDEVLVAVASSNAIEDQFAEGSWVMADDLALTNGTTVLGGVPNGGFEDWQEYSFEEPTDWNTNSFVGEPLVAQTTDAYSGDFAVRMENLYFEQFDDYAEAYLTNGEFGEDDLEGGQPFTERPEIVEGYYKYSPQETDTAFAYVQFWNDMDMIGFGYVEMLPEAEYTNFSVPIQYFDSADPNRLLILATPGFEEGSVLYLDDLQFSEAMSVYDQERVEIMVSPNPATTELSILLQENASVQEIFILNAEGRIVMRPEASWNDTRTELDISALNAGIYQLVLISDKGISNQSIVKH